MDFFSRKCGDIFAQIWQNILVQWLRMRGENLHIFKRQDIPTRNFDFFQFLWRYSNLKMTPNKCTVFITRELMRNILKTKQSNENMKIRKVFFIYNIRKAKQEWKTVDCILSQIEEENY